MRIILYAPVKLFQPLLFLLFAASNSVEVFFDAGSEVIVDKRVEMVLHQLDNRERCPCGDK